MISGFSKTLPVLEAGKSSKLTVTEIELLFGFPEHITDCGNLSATRMAKLLGRSWSVDAVTHLLKPLATYFQGRQKDPGS